MLDIFYLFGQENFVFVREKLVKGQVILQSDIHVCCNYVFLVYIVTNTSLHNYVFLLLQSRTPALVFEYVNNTDFKVSFYFYINIEICSFF